MPGAAIPPEIFRIIKSADHDGQGSWKSFLPKQSTVVQSFIGFRRKSREGENDLV
jgi:hypothetical protein